jgi:trimeric autotransporter adhesin
MRLRNWGLGLSLVAAVWFATLAFSQESTPVGSASASAVNGVVPGLINYNGVLTDINGKPLTGITGATFALYKEEQGGSPVWIETQNVTPDKTGHYTVTLGVTKPEGSLEDSFSNGEPRWLGVQVSGQPELARVLLVAVPYALKAGDAQTIGGLPASAFVLANSPQGTVSQSHNNTLAVTTHNTAAPPANPAVTGKGTAGFIPAWDTTSDIINSVMFQKSSLIGIGTTTPAAKLDVNGKGAIRDTLTLVPKSTDNTLAVNGTAFKISSTGQVTFISGQTFPGTGTITGVTTANGSGLSGGGTSGTLSLKVAPLGVTNAMLLNSTTTLNANSAGGITAPGTMTLGGTATIGLKTCSTNQILQFSGTTWNCSNLSSGTITGVLPGIDMTGGGTSGTVTLNLDTTKVPQLAAANNFTNNQTITGAGSGFALVVAPPTATGGLPGIPALEAIGSSADPNGLAAGGVGITVQGGGGGTLNISGNGGNAINASGGSAGNGNGGAGISVFGGFGVGGDLVERGSGGAGVVAIGGDSELFFGGDGVDATGGQGGQGENFASASGNGIVATGGQGGFEEADGSGGIFTGGNSEFGGFGIEVFGGSDSAAFFSGDIIVTGAVDAGIKDFKIDHPMDPANKYLYHASVESSEMMNIYTGNVTTDSQGNAEVQLPSWFETINADFRYQLTVIGQFAQAIVSQRVSGNQFAIKTDKPNVDVSWQITAVRQDAFAKAHPLVVEVPKNARERGFYLHPELYGAPAEKGIAWSHHPDTMRRVKAMRQQKKTASPVKAPVSTRGVRPVSAAQH